MAATAAQRAFSDFACAAASGLRARIDGISVTGSDAGGGIYVNGWAHGLQISNNRVYDNSGPYAGGVRIGQPYLEGQVVNPLTGGLSYNQKVAIHNAQEARRNAEKARIEQKKTFEHMVNLGQQVNTLSLIHI